MTDVLGLPFPSNRILSHWREQFLSLSPNGFWFGHLLVQSIELSVCVSQQTKLDPLSRFVLEAIGPFETSIQQLASRLGLAIPSITQILISNKEKGLVESSSGIWQLTEIGQSAWKTQSYPQYSHHRRSFSYLDLRPKQEPELLPGSLSELPSWEVPIADENRIDPSWVVNSLQQTEASKSLSQLPTNIIAVATLGSDPNPDWRRIPIIRMECLSVFAIRYSNEKDKIPLYPVFTDRWNIPTSEPIAILNPNFLPEMTEEDWRSSWIEWALHQGASLEDAESCLLMVQDDSIRVQPSKNTASQFVQYLQNLLHSNEQWLLAGNETMKQANRLIFSDFEVPIE
jgi:hypothetical protein